MNESGTWQLAPAYDVLFTYAPEGLLGTKHKLTVDDAQQGITLSNLLNVAKPAEVKNGKKIVEEVARSAVQWPSFARQAGVASQLGDQIGQYHEVKAVSANRA